MKEKNIKKLLLPALFLTLCFTLMNESVIQQDLEKDTPEQILPYSDFDDERNTEDI